MEEDINEIIKRLSMDADIVVINPGDTETLRNKGLPIKIIPPMSIEALFEERLKIATVVSAELPPVPSELFSQSIRSLYKEIQECILFNLNGAAITLMGILIEYTLKRVTFIKEMGGYERYDASKWKDFEDLDFAAAIGRAKRAGLLEAKHGKKLHWFREEIRNPYIHYNISTITKGTVAEKTKLLDLKANRYEEKDISADDSPIIQGIAKPIVDKHNVIDLFKFTNDVVSYLIMKINESIQNI